MPFESASNEQKPAPGETALKESDLSKLLEDPEVAERIAHAIKSLREYSQELLRRAESMREKDPVRAKIVGYEGSALGHAAGKYEERMAYWAKQIQAKEARGEDASTERRELQWEIAQAYLGSTVSVASSRYNAMLERLGFDRTPRIAGMRMKE